MATLGGLSAVIGLNTAALRADTMRAQGMFTNLTTGAVRGLGAITGSVATLGGALAGLGISVGVFAIFKSLTSIGSDFEQTMTTVSGVMRATSEETDRLTESARQMGETTEWTASQAGGALKFLGMAGFEVDKAIAALPGTLDLATAGTLELSRAADIASNALTAMGLPVESLDRINDVFIGTITRTNVSMEQMAESFKYGAPVARAFGYSVEELSAMIGALGNAGVQGSMAGTQLAMAMQQANKVARRFRYDSADLLDVLDSMAEEGRTNADVMELFGMRAGRAALILRDAIGPTRELQETLGGVAGEAATLADKMRSTLGGSYKEMKSVVESIKIDVFGSFVDGLKDQVRATTEWIRRNKEEILALVSGLMGGFALLWDVVSRIWDTLATIVSGITDVFDQLEVQSRETAESLTKDAETIRDAFKPPDFTPWEQMLHQTEMWGRTFVQVVWFVVKGVVQLVTGLTKFIVNDLLKNVLTALWEFAGAIERLTFLDFTGAWEQIQKVGGAFKDVQREGDETGRAVVRAWEKAFDDMLASFDFRSIEDVRIDVLFDKTRSEDAEKAIAGVGDAVVHTAKDVSTLTYGLEEMGDAARNLTDAQVTLYRELLSEGGKTRDGLLRLWEGYESARVKQIETEMAELYEIGMGVEVIAEIVDKRMKDLTDEQRELFEDQGDWLQGWAEELAGRLHGVFSDIFFDTMKGQFTSLVDYFEQIWDAFLRRIADKATSELMDLFQPSSGGGVFDLFGLLGGGGGSEEPVAMQHGGFVSRPTLAMIGEVPEVVVPLSRLRDGGFLSGLNEERGEGGDVNVSFNIQTPDVAGFKASQSQILTQAAVAMTMARRNM